MCQPRHVGVRHLTRHVVVAHFAPWQRFMARTVTSVVLTRRSLRYVTRCVIADTMQMMMCCQCCCCCRCDVIHAVRLLARRQLMTAAGTVVVTQIAAAAKTLVAAATTAAGAATAAPAAADVGAGAAAVEAAAVHLQHLLHGAHVVLAHGSLELLGLVAQVKDR